MIRRWKGAKSAFADCGGWHRGAAKGHQVRSVDSSVGAMSSRERNGSRGAFLGMTFRDVRRVPCAEAGGRESAQADFAKFQRRIHSLLEAGPQDA
jgi:hypothetical protein